MKRLNKSSRGALIAIIVGVALAVLGLIAAVVILMSILSPNWDQL